MAFLAAIPAALGSIASGVGGALSTVTGALGGIGSLVSAGAAIAGGIAQNNAAKAEAQVAKNNAKIAEDNAKVANTRQQEAVQEQDALTTAAIGEQLAIQGGSGLSINGRSQLLTRKTAAALGRQDAMNVNEAGERETRNYLQGSADAKTQANMAKAEGKNALLSGFITGAGNLIGSASSTKKSYGKKIAPVSYDPWAGAR